MVYTAGSVSLAMIEVLAHGIEESEERIKLGKTKEGSVWLTAKNDTDAVIIEIKDDGRGLNYEKIKNKFA